MHQQTPTRFWTIVGAARQLQVTERMVRKLVEIPANSRLGQGGPPRENRAQPPFRVMFERPTPRDVCPVTQARSPLDHP